MNLLLKYSIITKNIKDDFRTTNILAKNAMGKLEKLNIVKYKEKHDMTNVYCANKIFELLNK